MAQGRRGSRMTWNDDNVRTVRGIRPSYLTPSPPVSSSVSSPSSHHRSSEAHNISIHQLWNVILKTQRVNLDVNLAEVSAAWPGEQRPTVIALEGQLAAFRRHLPPGSNSKMVLHRGNLDAALAARAVGNRQDVTSASIQDEGERTAQADAEPTPENTQVRAPANASTHRNTTRMANATATPPAARTVARSTNAPATTIATPMTTSATTTSPPTASVASTGHASSISHGLPGWSTPPVSNQCKAKEPQGQYIPVFLPPFSTRETPRRTPKRTPMSLALPKNKSCIQDSLQFALERAASRCGRLNMLLYGGVMEV
ncbi:hypothetical protein ETB97_011903 [Aspergillus alliaceus]|uniref:Uncharacterized protein n=1 Tax=Petromyces alliaceus TaxID=209559 RepID=A0A8H6AAA5_PETAA|nr:hypothetical protein ETB97_011903 [Aspergillus burnettii]